MAAETEQPTDWVAEILRPWAVVTYRSGEAHCTHRKDLHFAVAAAAEAAVAEVVVPRKKAPEPEPEPEPQMIQMQQRDRKTWLSIYGLSTAEYRRGARMVLSCMYWMRSMFECGLVVLPN